MRRHITPSSLPTGPNVLRFMPLLTGYAILFLDVDVCEFVKSHAYLYIQLCEWGIVHNSLWSQPRDREKLSKDTDDWAGKSSICILKVIDELRPWTHLLKWQLWLQILDEKSLIKKYQREICNLKLELEQLRRGILQQPYLANASHEDLLYLRQQVRHVHMNISLFSWM